MHFWLYVLVCCVNAYFHPFIYRWPIWCFNKKYTSTINFPKYAYQLYLFSPPFYSVLIDFYYYLCWTVFCVKTKFGLFINLEIFLNFHLIIRHPIKNIVYLKIIKFSLAGRTLTVLTKIMLLLYPRQIYFLQSKREPARM